MKENKFKDVEELNNIEIINEITGNDVKSFDFSKIENYQYVIDQLGLSGWNKLRMFKVLNNRLKRNLFKRYGLVENSQLFGCAAVDFMAELEQEHVVVFAVDSKHQIIDYKVIFIGSLNSAIVHPREIFRYVLNFPVQGFVLVHNHPSGSAEPSEQDIKFTKKLQKGSKMLELEFIDHFIVGNNKYYSMRENQIF